MAGSGSNLLGRSWLQELAMEMHPVHQFESFLQGDPAQNNQLEQLLRKHVAVFKEELGTLKGLIAVIHMDLEAKPKLWSPDQSLMQSDP